MLGGTLACFATLRTHCASRYGPQFFPRVGAASRRGGAQNDMEVRYRSLPLPLNISPGTGTGTGTGTETDTDTGTD